MQVMIMMVELAIDDDGERPPAGTRIIVEARDTTLIDVAAPVVAEAAGVVQDSGNRLAALQLDVPEDAPRNLTIWAHVDVDGDDRVSPGDFITTASYPITESDAGAPRRVLVRQV
jgi:hypothetical protein